MPFIKQQKSSPLFFKIICGIVLISFAVFLGIGIFNTAQANYKFNISKANRANHNSQILMVKKQNVNNWNDNFFDSQEWKTYKNILISSYAKTMDERRIQLDSDYNEIFARSAVPEAQMEKDGATRRSQEALKPVNDEREDELKYTFLNDIQRTCVMSQRDNLTISNFAKQRSSDEGALGYGYNHESYALPEQNILNKIIVKFIDTHDIPCDKENATFSPSVAP